MTSDGAHEDYHLGSSDAEHERLIYQAVRLKPVTESFLREAGIDSGHRVLELGSGVGDVAMLLAEIVGRHGSVVAIEQDNRSIGRARTRADAAGLQNIQFVKSDISRFRGAGSFDAVVGRFILQFLPHPVEVLRSVAKTVRPGGVIAFQENSWAPFLALSTHLPLWSSAVSLLRDVALRAGVNVEMGPALHNAFQNAGLGAPRMRLEMELGHEPNFTRWVSDAIHSVRPQFEKFNVSIETLGELDTLEARLQREVAASDTVVPWVALVSAYCRMPQGQRVSEGRSNSFERR